MKIPNNLPASTGKGTNVEVTSQIIHTISNLANPNTNTLNSITIPSSNDNTGANTDIVNVQARVRAQLQSRAPGTESMDMTIASNQESLTTESKNELEYMTMLSQTTKHFTDKCQMLLQNLSTSGNVNRHHGDGDGGDDDDGKVKAEEKQQRDQEQVQVQVQLKEMKVLVEELRGHMEEMKKSRDDANERERRVRRGLYRVAAGRIEVAEVLKVRCVSWIIR